MKKSITVLLIILLSASKLILGQTADKNLDKRAHDAYKMLLKETDKNNDGKISKAEFFAIWKDKKIAEEKYKVWDVNKDGYITEEEYVKVAKDLGRKKK